MKASCSSQTYLWHLQIAEFIPEILDRVQSNKSHAEHTHPLHTAHTSNRDAAQHQPETPFRREWVVPLVVELGPGEDRRECEEEQHAVEQNEPADRSIAVLKQHHSRD